MSDMMTAEQLKGSILQLAMQGKLVEQKPEEGTGEELYKEIQAEKRALIKAGKIKKEKPLPEISEEEKPFDIPDSWIWVRIGKIVNHLFAGGDKPADFTEFADERRKIPVIANGITNDGILGYTAIATAKANTITVAGRGTIGFSLFRDYEYYPVVRLIVLEQNSHVFPQFLQRVIEALPEKSLGTSIPQLTVPMLYPKLIPLPPLEEQKRIVAKIEELMPFVEQYAVASTKLNTLNTTFPDLMKKSILQEAVQGKLVPQDPNDEPASVLLEKIAEEKKRLIKEGKIKKQKPMPEITVDEIPFDIPESWEWARWGTISESIQYGYNAPALESGRIKMVRISDIQNNTVKWDTVPYCDIKEDIIPDYLLKENDILFARTGGTVGKSFLVKEVAENAIYAGYLIRTRYSRNLCPEYLKYFMESDLYWRQLRNGTIATAQPNCNGQTLSKMLIPIPPLKEQYRIANKLKAVLVPTEGLK